MQSVWTVDQILALAPDAASAKSGQGLSTRGKWLSLGCADAALWGECQGSGSKPYQAEIDLSEPAFKCTCPSRKFPCKHGLGLFLLFAGTPDAFAVSSPPGWVAEWLSVRAQRQKKRRSQGSEQSEEKPSARTPADGAEDGAEDGARDEEQTGAAAAVNGAIATDPAAVAKRAAVREARVAAGLAELDLWLRDLVRRGLAAVQAQPYRFWDGPASRLVDAQAPGAARLVRRMAGIPAMGEGWPEVLLERLGGLHLLIEGYRRIDLLPPELQADVRQAIGRTRGQEEILAGPGVRDRWVVLGQRVEAEDRLRVQRIWLWGRSTGRPALVLSFAHGNAPLDVSLVAGTSVEAEVAFYPSAAPLRALVKERLSEPGQETAMPGYATIEEAMKAWASALAENPWMERLPCPLRRTIPLYTGPACPPDVHDEGSTAAARPARTEWAVSDADSRRLRLDPRSGPYWELVSLSGGCPMDLFGEWDGEWFLPLSAWTPDRILPLEPPV